VSRSISVACGSWTCRAHAASGERSTPGDTCLCLPVW
jgi:hypothetical protein